VLGWVLALMQLIVWFLILMVADMHESIVTGAHSIDGLLKRKRKKREKRKFDSNKLKVFLVFDTCQYDKYNRNVEENIKKIYIYIEMTKTISGEIQITFLSFFLSFRNDVYVYNHCI
jgi:hypothetical protein